MYYGDGQRGQDARMPGQGSHACCARRSSSETVVRCCCFSGALEPNEWVARTVTRRFLTSRRQRSGSQFRARAVHARGPWSTSSHGPRRRGITWKCVRGPPLQPNTLQDSFNRAWVVGTMVCRSQSTAPSALLHRHRERLIGNRNVS